MKSVPVEVTTQILSLLPARSVLRCRSVCKTWRNLIDEPGFTALHFNREIENESHPGNSKQTRFFLRPFTFNDGGGLAIYLVEQHGQESHIFNCRRMSLSLQETAISPEPELLSLTAANGLLYVSDFRKAGLYMTSICNPFTGHSLMLPELVSRRAKKGLVTSGFGYDESNKVFKVVHMFYPSNLSGTQAHVYTLGSNSPWKKLENAPSVICRRSAVAVNGHLHWLPSSATSILSFQLASERFGVIPVPELVSSSHGLCYVTQIDGCLSIADLNSSDHIILWVMMDYGASESWTKFVLSRTNLENQASIMSIQPISFWKEGEILLVCDSRTIASYNVESNSYTPLDVRGLPDCTSYEVFPYCGNLLSLRSAN